MQLLAEEFAHTENVSAFIHTISPLSSAANPSLQEISRTITYVPPPQSKEQEVQMGTETQMSMPTPQ